MGHGGCRSFASMAVLALLVFTVTPAHAAISPSPPPPSPPPANPPSLPPPVTAVFAELRLALITSLSAFNQPGVQAQLLASIAAQIPGLTAPRLRLISAEQRSASEFWGEGRRRLAGASGGGGGLASPLFVQVRIGFTLAYGAVSPSLADAAALDLVVLRLKAAARGDENDRFLLTVPYVPKRSVLCRGEFAYPHLDVATRTRLAANCEELSAATSFHFRGAPPPNAPSAAQRGPLLPPQPPPVPAPPLAPPPAPWAIAALPWLVPVGILGALVLCSLCAINCCIVRRLLLHPARIDAGAGGTADAPSMQQPKRPHAKSKVAAAAGARPSAGRNRRQPPATDDDEQEEEEPTRGRARNRSKDRTAEYESDEVEHDGVGRASAAAGGCGKLGPATRQPGARAHSRHRLVEPESPRKLPLSADGGTAPPPLSLPFSPRGDLPNTGIGNVLTEHFWGPSFSPLYGRPCKYASAFGEAPIVARGARCVDGPLGKPTWALPPVYPSSSDGSRGARALRMPPRGFTDEPPPESRRLAEADAPLSPGLGGTWSAGRPPPAGGPAPWIPGIDMVSPSRRQQQQQQGAYARGGQTWIPEPLSLGSTRGSPELDATAGVAAEDRAGIYAGDRAGDRAGGREMSPREAALRLRQQNATLRDELYGLRNDAAAADAASSVCSHGLRRASPAYPAVAEGARPWEHSTMPKVKLASSSVHPAATLKQAKATKVASRKLLPIKRAASSKKAEKKVIFATETETEPTPPPELSLAERARERVRQRRERRVAMLKDEGGSAEEEG